MIARYKNEAEFERSITAYAPLFGCDYYKIPDVIPAKQMPKAHRRPFDGILVVPQGNIAIECKYQYNTLEAHQRAALSAIEQINGMAYVLRYVVLKNRDEFRVERTDKTVIFATGQIEDIFHFLKGRGAWSIN